MSKSEIIKNAKDLRIADGLIKILGSYDEEVDDEDINKAEALVDKYSESIGKGEFETELLAAILELWALISMYDEEEYGASNWEAIVIYADNIFAHDFMPSSPRLNDLIVAKNESEEADRKKRLIYAINVKKERDDAARVKTLLRILSVWAIVVIILIALFYQKISDDLVINNASSELTTLAQNAGMSRTLELAFFRANPVFDGANQLKTDCQSISNDGSFVEQGCFIPATSSDDDKDHIYIRQFSDSRLVPEENVVAAHEALHAIYYHMDSTDQSHVNKLVEAQYSSMNNSDLTARMAIYSKIESGEQDNELNSILGTEQTTLSSDLEAYYNTYFTNRQLDVASNEQVAQVISGISSQLTALSNKIDNEQANDEQLYRNSVYEANLGSEYLNVQYYNQYITLYNSINTEIQSYNSQIEDYNALVADFNGTALSSIPVQAQQ